MSDELEQFISDMADPETREKMDLPPEKLFDYALKFHRKGDLINAEGLYRTLLGVAPNHPDVLHYAGLLQFQIGQVDEGIHFVQLALEQAPAYAAAHNNLGNMYRKQQRLEEAEQAYRTATEQQADHGEAWHNLGQLLNLLGREEEAATALRRASELNPQLEPITFDLVHTFIGLRNLDRLEEAATVLREHLSQHPDTSWAQHLLAGITGENVPERAAEDYLVELFDRYAECFDDNMARLKCVAPRLVAEAVQQARPGVETLRILDAGCGTGLSGVPLAGFAEHLEGVDIAPLMVEAARERGIYQELHVAELTAFLESKPAAWDVIAAADTFEYFGDLSALTAACARALVPGGLLVYSVEYLADEEHERGYHLHSHGRFTQNERYLRETLDEAGFAVRCIERAVIRLDGGEPVDALLVSAEKPAT